MNIRKLLPFSVVLLTAALALPPAAAAAGCWVCLWVAGGNVDCSTSTIDDGGTSCTNKCQTIGDVETCSCTTSGACGAGAFGCGGQPCPTSIAPGDDDAYSAVAQALRAQAVQAERERQFRLGLGKDAGLRAPADDLRVVKATRPMVSLLLETLAASGRTEGSGSAAGILTVRPVEGGEVLAFPFEAQLTPMAGGWDVWVQVIGHPEITAVAAEIGENGRWSRVELFSPGGTSEVLLPDPPAQ